MRRLSRSVNGETWHYWYGRHVVYRHYSGDTLLYVGATFDAWERHRSHRLKSPWWPQVTKVVMRLHPTRQAALDVERMAIAEEAPLYNDITARRALRAVA